MKGFFSCNVLTHEEILKKLNQKQAQQFEKASFDGEIDDKLADRLAGIIKSWAIKRGATHFAHVFYPLSGKPAMKFTSFIGRDGKGEFNGQMLLKSETDASSFPSGGNRSASRARGIVLWDRVSPIYIDEMGIGKVLCLPSFFVSIDGTALDEKAPLFRASRKLSEHLTKILSSFSIPCKNSFFTLGIEQEYFIIPKERLDTRPDLQLLGRSMFNNNNVPNQQFCAHYFSLPEEKVLFYMKKLNRELLKLGVVVKTQHSEVAPCQFELVPLFDNVEKAFLTSHLVRDKIEIVANECGFKTLFHEKPFAGLNGSGKHNNWSLVTSEGINLLDPSLVNEDIFMFLISCILQFVNKHSDLLRLSACSYSNDQRLGGNEAPPTTISVYVGGGGVQQRIDNKLGQKHITIDKCDRNRTSPFAFTGNKFEFRMLGSNQSVAFCNTVIMSGLVEELKFAEKVFVDKGYNLDALRGLTHKNLSAATKIIYNGDNYSTSWKELSEKRNLKSLNCFKEAIGALSRKENIKMLVGNHAMSREEIFVYESVLKEKYVDEALYELEILNNLINNHLITKLQKDNKIYENNCEKVAEIQKHLKEAQNMNINFDNVEQVKDVVEQVCSLVGELKLPDIKNDLELLLSNR